MYSRWSTSVVSVCSTSSDRSASTISETTIYTQQPEPNDAFTLNAKAIKASSARLEKKTTKTEKFRLLIDEAQSDIHKKYDEYTNQPETHPDYTYEWKIFWERRYRELSAANQTIDPRSLRGEWVIFWKQILERKLKREIESKKQEISRRLWISNYELTEIENMFTKEHEKLPAPRRPYSSSKETRNMLSSSERNNVSRKRPSTSPQRSRPTHERSSCLSTQRSQSPRKDHRRSLSPHRRSRPSERINRSSQRRSRLPQRRIRSPQRRSHSPQRRSHSPQRRSHSRSPLSPQRHSPQERSYSTQRKHQLPQRKSRSPRTTGFLRTSPKKSRRRVCMDFDKKRFNWIKPTITSVLGLLTALEDILGSLAPKVIELMREVIAMNKANANSSNQLLDDEDHFVLFQTIKEKLQGLLSANFVESNRENAVKKAIKDITYLVDETDARMKASRVESTITNEQILKILSPQKHLSTLISPIRQKSISPLKSVFPLKSVSPLKSTSPSNLPTPQKNPPPAVSNEEREAITALLNAAFINAGITNVTGKQLQDLSDVYIAELAQKKSISEDKKESSMDMIVIKREELYNCKTNDTVDVPTPSSSSRPFSSLNVLPISSSLSHFQPNEKVTLSDMELKILAKKFHLLSSKEQKTYQAYMKKLEIEDPDRFKQLTGNKTS